MSATPTFEFHVSRPSRDRYGFDQELFSLTGHVMFANPAASREFAHRMNLVRDAERYPERTVHPGELHAMGVIDEALHAILWAYRQEQDPQVLEHALAWYESRQGRDARDRALLAFADQFPTVSVYAGELTAAEWLAGSTGGVDHRAVALEEMILLWLSNLNPAYRPYTELFDDQPLARSTAYPEMTAVLRDFFQERPGFGPENQNLVDVLRAPMLASPESLEGQLAYLREKFGSILEAFEVRGPAAAWRRPRAAEGQGSASLTRYMATALDVLKEEQLAIWMRYHPPVQTGGGPPALGDSSAEAVPSFSAQVHEYEAFSPDVDWMPRTVLIAKTVFVWLDQLSRRYGRHIHRLDQIPDEELEILARRGFNALWLIGVWERSRASQRIKQLCGNPEAVASAYSLYDYNIAEDLGGDAAFNNLRDRARARGIRLASDMVPNHMAIDSRWMIQHPEWFLAAPDKPYPVYSFTGPDLSSDGRVEIKVEDHYYDRTDAAVVFRRVDRWSGEARYIYHGNDGTTYPWNDTAQLNYLLPEVREGVIQTILHVARQFPLIRFDAAMTLAKRHYQRLWFPLPGMAGAIPSRAEHGLTREEFDTAFPVEFWREVVDRVAVEAPGTLLLAEAFWMMEGYFVRTLGMHRVYNSAFMNMLRDEENANYRNVIKNTLEFDPEVLKRYVNFVNNPDERTAVDQFGSGDKYFGVCVLMSTLPGLPMFGHGQIEGLTEKYGMEYRRAYYDEQPDPWLVARHEREISPLLHRRALFAEVVDFLLYDFYTDAGRVSEDVFAFSNRRGAECALVVYHNRYAETRGWVQRSCAYMEKRADGEKYLRQRTMGESFALSDDPAMLVAFRDALTGLEYLHRSRTLAEKGLHLELGAYRCHVFLDWRSIRDDGRRPWGVLCERLAGSGVSSLEEALRALELQPVQQALQELLQPARVEALARCCAAPEKPVAEAAGESAAKSEDEAAVGTAGEAEKPAIGEEVVAAETVPPAEAVAEAEHALRSLLRETWKVAGAVGVPPAQRERPWDRIANLEPAVADFRRRLHAALGLSAIETLFAQPWPAEAHEVLPTAQAGAAEAVRAWGALLGWCALEAMGRFQNPGDPKHAASALFDTLHLREPLAQAFAALGYPGEESWKAAARVRASLAHAPAAPGARPVTKRPAAPFSWLLDPDVSWVIGVHAHQGVSYFVKEHFQRLIWWMALDELLAIASAPAAEAGRARALEAQLVDCTEAAEQAGYQVEELFDQAWK